MDVQTEAVESKEDAYPVQVDYHGTPLVLGATGVHRRLYENQGSCM